MSKNIKSILAATLALALGGGLILWSSCKEPVGSPIAQQEVDDVVLAWKDRGLPYTDACVVEKEDLRAVVESSNQVSTDCWNQACQKPEDINCVTSCYLPNALLVIQVKGFDGPHVRGHELLHWLQNCGLGVVDYKHTDKRIWGNTGVEGTLPHWGTK